MKTRHFFVSVLDVNEMLPFMVKKKANLGQSMDEQERARNELEKFIDLLSKSFKEPVWYMGMDIISGKSYERFIFENGGFFEVMVEAPIALNAHFVHQKRGAQFAKALQETLRKQLPASPITEMFLHSIEVQDEAHGTDQSLTFKDWDKMKDIRKTAGKKKK
ncbi:hypothetical protein HZB02_05355 [Candidatus Woesearchaeota archaeon]|nr:hypothetical protein [Candidatus Woesearchaeota archaeon]